MSHEDAIRRKRLLVAVSVAGSVCLGATVVLFIFEPTHQRFLGVNVADGLTGTAYLSATTLLVVSARLLRAVVRPKARAITVRELRRRGRSPR